jgi:hypothetical protein
MAKKTTWWSKCAICGRTFPIWWVSKAEWDAGGFKKKHVCKKCFETKVPTPHYFSVDEYLADTEAANLEVLKRKYPWYRAYHMKRDMARMRAELVKVWEK